jgi:N-glycosylase/DNA lyase
MADTTCSRNGYHSGAIEAAEVTSAAAEEVTAPAGHDFWMRVAERFGVPVVILLLVLWWARTDLVQPLLEQHFQFLESVTTANKQHTEELKNIGGKLDRLIDIQSP